MLKLLQGILANKITTEDVTTSGAPRMRGQLTCGTDCMAVQNVRLFARLVLLRCVMANQYWIINAAFFVVNV